MREDVLKLMRVAGWQEGAYAEVAAEQGAAEAAGAWPLLAAVNGRLQGGCTGSGGGPPEGGR
jgi:hypothetical protein